jgi:Zn ribbon nucleic-acid-binding protein
MNRSNYALISTLYDTKGADLYNDIYFPIIKYEIVNQFYTQNDIEKYYDLEELQRLINVDFGVIIPLVVLRQSIKAIGNGDNGISLSVFENGKQFKIKKAWDITINTFIDNKSQELSAKFSQLEILYKRFLEIEQLPYDKSFLDFYSDNTAEIFKYVEEADGNSIINEKHVNLARFLSWIKEYNNDLYNIANDIFWGSIIAGFLKRNTADINIKSTERVEYYLDSALVLAVLDLDNTDNVSYAQELLDIIKSSGNTPKVHSLTIREISGILTSVERDQGPRPNSAIEEAYHRRGLTPTKILQIKNRLLRSIEEKGIIVFSVNERELGKIEADYRVKKSVKELSEIRQSHVYNNNNSIRDIHDIYLRDFIQRKRGDVASIEKINSYFVSLNTDLISFGNKDNPRRVSPIIIHPSKIVVDLWIHNSTSSFVRKNGLTEVMSRCFALNNTDIRRKLKVVSKYYKDSDENYSDENYRAVYSALIGRSTKALKEVDAISLNEQENIENKEEVNKGHIQVLIKISVDESVRKQQNVLALSEEKETLTATIDTQKQSLVNSEEASKKDKEQIAKLEKELECQKKINEINNKITPISNELSDLEKKKEKSLSNVKFIIIISLEILFGAAFIICLILLIYSYLKNEDIVNFGQYILDNIGLFTTACVTGIGIIYRIQKMYLFSPKIAHENNQEEQVKYWIKKNPKYNELKEDLKKLQDQRAALNSMN